MRPAALRVGLFALVGTALLSLAVVIAAGRWFAASERAVMRFESSVYGLQVGAPVVFRGVRVGQVHAIGLAPQDEGGVAIPVTVEFDRALMRDLVGGPPSAGPAVAVLAGRGLVARLAMQSLLTGQLYVDMDLDPSRATAQAPAQADPAALPSIPTAPTRLQTLQAQLEGVDLAQIGRDLAAIASAARGLAEGPEPTRALARAADAAEALERLAERAERELGPLLRSVRATLAQSERALGEMDRGAQRVGAAADRFGTLADAGAPALAEIRRAADELARASAALGEAVGDDSALRTGAEQALKDVSNAARALRELGETLDRHPDALLRGRAAAP